MRRDSRFEESLKLTSQIWDHGWCQGRGEGKSPTLSTLPELNDVSLYFSFTLNSWSPRSLFTFLLCGSVAMSGSGGQSAASLNL